MEKDVLDLIRAREDSDHWRNILSNLDHFSSLSDLEQTKYAFSFCIIARTESRQSSLWVFDSELHKEVELNKRAG